MCIFPSASFVPTTGIFTRTESFDYVQNDRKTKKVSILATTVKNFLCISASLVRFQGKTKRHELSFSHQPNSLSCTTPYFFTDAINLGGKHGNRIFPHFFVTSPPQSLEEKKNWMFQTGLPVDQLRLPFKKHRLRYRNLGYFPG